MVSGSRQGRPLLLKLVDEVGYVQERAVRAVFVLEVPQFRVRTPYTGNVTAI